MKTLPIIVITKVYQIKPCFKVIQWLQNFKKMNHYEIWNDYLTILLNLFRLFLKKTEWNICVNNKIYNSFVIVVSLKLRLQIRVVSFIKFGLFTIQCLCFAIMISCLLQWFFVNMRAKTIGTQYAWLNDSIQNWM